MEDALFLSALIGFAAYIAGMFIVGIPLGVWSLKVWKNPKNYPILKNILFPIKGIIHNAVGEVTTVRCRHMYYEETKLLFFTPHVARAIRQKDEEVLKKYIHQTMQWWPYRVTWIVFSVPVLLFIYKPILLFNKVTMIVLNRCKKCTDI